MGLDKSACVNQSQNLLDDEQLFPYRVLEELSTIQTQSGTSRWLYAYRAFLVN